MAARRTKAKDADAALIALTDRIIHAVEAILLSLDRPVPAQKIAAAVFHPVAAKPKDSAEDDDDGPDESDASAAETKAIDEAVAALNAAYEQTGRTFRVEAVAGGYRLMTLPEYAEPVAAFRRARATAKLSRAAVETLAIIAYRQPVTRAELEAIRGVACGEVLKSLMDRRLVTITGRAEELGRPLLYGTTKGFLDHFGLASLKDLPAPAELKANPGA